MVYVASYRIAYRASNPFTELGQRKLGRAIFSACVRALVLRAILEII